MDVGILHPGQMGVQVAASIRNGGNVVHWASAGRRAQSRARAEGAGLVDAKTLDALVDQCAVLVSVCPPAAAGEVAADVAALGFTGTFVDANAVAPQHVQAIETLLGNAGAVVVDGSIAARPAGHRGTTLYLSGPAAHSVVELFAAGPMQAQVIGATVGQASALKVCLAGESKTLIALQCALLAVADEFGVRDAVAAHWGEERTGALMSRISDAAPNAWRFAGEMDEYVAALSALGLPAGFHLAASELFDRLVSCKEMSPSPGVDHVLSLVRQ